MCVGILCVCSWVSSLIFLYFPRQDLCLNLAVTDLDSLASQLAPGVPCSHLLELELQVSCHAQLVFMWVLMI